MKTVLSILRNFFNDASGVITVEFALVAPVLVVALLGIGDYIMAFSAQMKLHNAVQAGASYCMKNGSSACTLANVQNAVVNATPLPVTTANVGLTLSYGCASTSGITLQGSSTPNCANGFAPGLYAVITATYQYTTTVGPVVIPMSSTTTLRIQ
jgi:Flp pilus assembly protein TadG